jgi:hypothetical protein
MKVRNGSFADGPLWSVGQSAIRAFGMTVMGGKRTYPDVLLAQPH